MKVTKLNESFSVIDGDAETLKNIYDFLKVERPGAFFDPLVKSGFKSKYEYFASIQHKKLLVLNGVLDMLGYFGITPLVHQPEYSENVLDDFLNNIKNTLPFQPYDFQITAFKQSILAGKQINKMCTSSGKSLVIGLIAEFFRQHAKRGILLVPNINLLEQMRGDFESYNLSKLCENTHIIGGGETDRHFNKSLTISTWQSLINYKEGLNKLDYVITDETHRFASTETSAIVQETLNCKYKFGFTGTIPECPVQKMQLFGLFGLPKTFITSSELIERKLATPININSIILRYNQNDLNVFKHVGDYPKKIKFLKEHNARNKFIVDLSCKLKNNGNTLVLGQHIDHLKTMYLDIMHKLYPEVENIPNKHITGKKSFQFQKQYKVYYISGTDDTKTRELTRKILENDDDAILVSNYQLLSTGVNIRKLHNLVLAAPLKSYTSITQSIGRLMRLHPSKTEANVYDLIDSTNLRTIGGIFYKQYLHRKQTSYTPEEYSIKEVIYELF